MQEKRTGEGSVFNGTCFQVRVSRWHNHFLVAPCSSNASQQSLCGFTKSSSWILSLKAPWLPDLCNPLSVLDVVSAGASIVLMPV